jgi:Predicted nucleoside-diphosphate sugar epimerases
MTIGEAAYLVIISSIISSSSEVYMLKMGDPVKILDIAKKMIRLSGNSIKDENNPQGIEILFTGLRPGEKLYEELLIDENDAKTDHPKIFIDSSSKKIDSDQFKQIKEDIKMSLSSNSLQDLQSILKKHADYVVDDESVDLNS